MIRLGIRIAESEGSIKLEGIYCFNIVAEHDEETRTSGVLEEILG